jgi:flagellar basal-body rod protein FlgF
MDRALYVAMTGAKQLLQAQASNSHNLANASTPGFRADLTDFRSMPVFGQGLPSRVYAMEERPGVDMKPGPIDATGRELDMAINGDGWIAVQGPDGNEAYTRAGDLRISSGNILETGAGHPVMGQGGPIAIPPAEKIEIGTDGTVSIRPLGEHASTLVQVDKIKLVKPPLDQLEKGADGLMRLKNNGVAEADASVTLVPGALEGSNVNTVEALVNMIQWAREFELQIKAMRTAEDNDSSSTQMMRV